MERSLSVLYRGPLSSCNYGCPYCPFAKRHETAAELKHDRERLTRFLEWAETPQFESLGVLFTPWGEALTRRWYREAMVRLSHLRHIRRVAAQTNLSCKLDWLADADRETLALWCTYHPGETSRSQFLRQCRQLLDREIRFSVGVVGLREHAEEIEALRAALPDNIYVWVNAYKREADYYDAEMMNRLRRLDPLFGFNAVRHPSRNKACHTGETVFTVDGAGDMRRCHFVDGVIGNIYRDDWRDALRPRTCPNEVCGCHIGYIHMPDLGLQRVFGDSMLERIPEVSDRRMRLEAESLDASSDSADVIIGHQE